MLEKLTATQNSKLDKYKMKSFKTKTCLTHLSLALYIIMTGFYETQHWAKM